MKILFAGGGTMGSVSPLVAIYQELKERDANLEVLWLGTKKGPEKDFLAEYKIPFKPIICGKWRQYFSLSNLCTPLFVLLGFFQCLFVLRKFKPEIVLTAGSFVAVPLMYAAWFLRIPRFAHQQDLEIGLANKLMIKKATIVTVTFSDVIDKLPYKKTFKISNPVRKEVFLGNRERAAQFFKLDLSVPTILIMGGGTGAQIINETTLEILGQLVEKYQIIHLTGAGKGISDEFANYFDRETLKRIEEKYRAYEFLNKEIFDAYALADLVISRAGFAALTEFSVLSKAVLLIPIPGHQEFNARYFAKFNAVKVLNQKDLNKETFWQTIEYLMENSAERATLSRNIIGMIDKDAAKRYVDLIYKAIEK
ncbi:UDP-N-acetylglucosamine--N-acetylmuramyl-(pentapeptide) pyrophosphoryl-undecaprenol N-acetylglucosamine transferase [Candidatus Falkowbacteria bacterium]|nr:UDP-N-acetylglucosamine--N-acetylmuramyl-(pentapeptide) pyrophosphoryl-undecaprenol N-acetylglucosamine transferase [Candidatus Falkowbacteria bacterium]